MDTHEWEDEAEHLANADLNFIEAEAYRLDHPDFTMDTPDIGICCLVIKKVKKRYEIPL